MEHPPLTDLVDRASEPDVALHLSSCAPCRARARLLSSEVGADLPGLEVAREAMARVRLQMSQQVTRSISGESHVEPDDLEMGSVVGRYRVEALIGRGGMGSVYRVRHVQLDSLHALKLLHRTSRSVQKRLVREGRAQSKLVHPNVVPVTDIIDVDGSPGLILEYVPGPTLAEHLRRDGPPPLDEADRLAAQIVRGVSAAHAQGVVHRDLKPGNVLLLPTDEGHVAKVTDFGLARELADDVDLTGSHTPLGTPAYMAPEQIRDASRADERSDVFSLGALLYELVTGKRAFDGLDVVSIYDRVRAGEYTPPDVLVPGLPPRITHTIATALRTDPAERFPDCRALLASWRGNPDVEPSVITGGGAPRRVVGLRIGLPLGVAAASAALALGAVGMWAFTPPSHDEVAEVAAPPSATVKERRLTALPDELQVYAMGLSPDGARMAFTDGRGVFVQDVDDGTPRRILAGGPYHNIAFLPDGDQLLVSGWSGGEPGTWALRADGSDQRLLFPDTGSWVKLSPDGTRIAVADESGIWVGDVDGQNRRRVRSLSGADSTGGLAWSPSGRFLAAVHASSAGGAPWLEVSAVDGSSTRRLLESEGLAPLGIAALTWLAPDTLVYAVSTEHDGEFASTAFALDGAELASDVAAATELYRWTGFVVLRFEPSADGSRIATSRVKATQRAHLLDVESPDALVAVTRDDWSETPVGWLAPDRLLTVSSRGGGGLYEYHLPNPEPVRRWEGDTHIGRVQRVRDGFVVVRKGESEYDVLELTIERRDAEGRLVRALASSSIEMSVGKRSVGKHWFRCGDDRCLFSGPEGAAVRFWWVDATTGEASDTVLRVPLDARSAAWDLDLEQRRLAIATTDPPRLTVHDLVSGEVVEWRTRVDLVHSVAFSPDGRAIYLAGLSDASESPYQIVSISPEGQATIVWQAMSSNAHSLEVSPDGRHIAAAVNVYEDDVWLVEGLLGTFPKISRAGG